MRVNVYWEELSDAPPEIIERSAGNRGLPFWGLRIWLKSPVELHRNLGDDDRSAVTFWFDSIASLNDFAERLYMRRLPHG